MESLKGGRYRKLSRFLGHTACVDLLFDSSTSVSKRLAGNSGFSCPFFRNIHFEDLTCVSLFSDGSLFWGFKENTMTTNVL